MEFEHFTVRGIEPSDLPRYFRLIDRNRPRLEDFFAGTVARTKTLPDTEIFLAEIVRKAAEKSYLPFVITDNNSQEIAGFIDVKNIDWNLPKAELGCFIDEGYTGQGIARKALRLVIARLFTESGFQKLFLRTHETNTAARKLAEDCGFLVEGVIRKDYKTTKGDLVDLVYYGIVRD
jgi:RimJ/RimL family protein N-acetyltransferase